MGIETIFVESQRPYKESENLSVESPTKGFCFLDNYIILISGISTLLKIVASVLLTIFAISIAGNIASVSEIFMKQPQTQLVNDGILNGSTSISTPILVTTLSVKPSKYS